MSQLFLLGLNHKTAPVEVREQLALGPSRLGPALQFLRAGRGVREAAILSTCNRAEIYAVGEASVAPRLEQFLDEFHRVPARGLANHLYRHHDLESARHLFRVTSGIDSLVLGESEILGQVKTAFEAARAEGAISNVLDELFRRAIACGKRARSETGIGRGALNVGSAAVELARQIFGPLAGHTVLILGAGKMSSLTARHLVQSGAHRVIVANRTYAHALELAQLFDDAPGDKVLSGARAEAVTWEEFPQRLIEADIVIASTRAPHLILSAEHVAQAMKARRQRPLFLIDIAVPRDIDPNAHQLDNVFLYDIDDLQGVVNANLAQRNSELSGVEAIVESEAQSWQSWMKTLDAQPVMAALAQRANQIRDNEVEAALAQMPNLSAREQEIVRALGRGIAGKLIHAPLRHLRQSHGADDAPVLRRAFDLDAVSSANKNTSNEQAENSERAAPAQDGHPTLSVPDESAKLKSNEQAQNAHARIDAGAQSTLIDTHTQSTLRAPDMDTNEQAARVGGGRQSTLRVSNEQARTERFVDEDVDVEVAR